MSKFQWSMAGLGALWLTVVIILLVDLDSERSKRIELEAEVGRLENTIIGIKSSIVKLPSGYMSTYFPYANVPEGSTIDSVKFIVLPRDSFDSLLAVPPKDSFGKRTFFRVDDDYIRRIIDSSGVIE